MKIGIVGSKKYTNRRKIQEFIFKLREGTSDQLEIVSGGERIGAESYVKKYTLEFDINYSEFPPVHHNYNHYCVKESYHYGKRYNVGNYFVRNKEIVNYCESIVVFKPIGVRCTSSENIIAESKKQNKKVVLVN